MLSESEEARYQRNIRVPEIGVAGQKKLFQGRVLVIGAGGLGSPALAYLACAGVGTLGILDNDFVELSNLQRQILHFTSDLQQLKIRSASGKIAALNPNVRIVTHQVRFSAENGRSIVRDYDFVIEATDNFASKFAVNDACVQENVPYSHAGAMGLVGQAMTVIPGKGPCFRCVFGGVENTEKAPMPSEIGILGTVAGVLGCVQASEAIKYLAEFGELLVGRLLTYNALDSSFRTVPLPKGNCPVCRKSKTEA
ncbi:MAG: HesA/MoeB/ThiF family protein [Deltaproteobacteria bacterium]|nr:HesA/MoeB/ThiF family protein [Deltaproteobacteria bacterium]